MNDILLLSLAQALTGGQVEGPTANARRCFVRAIDFIETHFAQVTLTNAGMTAE